MESEPVNTVVLELGAFDATAAGEAFAWAFVGVLTVYLVAWGCGEIFKFLDSSK